MGALRLPSDQFVPKVHSQFDLTCDHCHVYETAAQGWRGRPKAIWMRSADDPQRIAEHASSRTERGPGCAERWRVAAGRCSRTAENGHRASVRDVMYATLMCAYKRIVFSWRIISKSSLRRSVFVFVFSLTVITLPITGICVMQTGSASTIMFNLLRTG